jgi:hypothetical protein
MSPSVSFLIYLKRQVIHHVMAGIVGNVIPGETNAVGSRAAVGDVTYESIRSPRRLYHRRPHGDALRLLCRQHPARPHSISTECVH